MEKNNNTLFKFQIISVSKYFISFIVVLYPRITFFFLILSVVIKKEYSIY